MTTPTTPGNPLSASDISDEINPSGYVQGEQSIGSNVVIRKLSGDFEKFRSNTVELSFGDLSNKTAFSEILAVSTSNTQSGISTAANPVTSTLTLNANSDMVEPVINWSYEFLPGSTATADDITITRNIVFAPNGRPSSKSANVKLTSLSGDKHANVRITAQMVVPNYDAQGLFETGNHIVNTCTKDITLTVNAVNTAFQVTATPSFTVNATGVSAQTATITVKASANNSLNQSFVFTPTFVSGTGALTPIIGSDTVTFTATASRPLTNSAIYSLLTEFYSDGKLVAANTSTVDLRAQFIDRQITSFTAAATTNNQFTNASSQYATIDVTAVHNAVAPGFPQGTVTVTVETVGDAVTTQTISSNSSTKVERISLFHDFVVDGFGLKKATVNVVATLRAPDNTIMDQKRITGLVLRAGAYGLDIKVPASNTQSGYAAQTAVTSGSATWRATAASFKWTERQFGGTGPLTVIDNAPTSATINITATTPTGKNRPQSISNTSSYDLTGTLTFDGVTITTVTLSDILVKAESLPYTFSVTPAAASNVQVDVTNATTASLLVTGAASVGTIAWTKNNGDVGITTTSTTANVFVVSSGSGGSNNQNVIVTGTLSDPSARVVEIIPTDVLNIDATTTKLEILGANVSITTDQATATATGIFESTALVGSHLLVFPPAKQSGSDLTLTKDTDQKITIQATATQSSKSGVYRIIGQVNYRGITRTTTKDVSVAVSALAPSLTATKTQYSYLQYTSFTGVSFTGFSGQVTGVEQETTPVLITGEDVVVESDYPGTINVDYEIRRTGTIIGKVNGVPTTFVYGPFYNQAANTDLAPDGFPASINKRRDRFEIVPFIGILLEYDVTYELYAPAGPNGIFLKDLNVSSVIRPPTSDVDIVLSFNNVTSKTFTVTDKPLNNNGYNEPYPLSVEYSQRADYTASFVTELSLNTPRFVFSTVATGGINAPVAAAGDITVTSNSINGQANVLVKSTYYDSGSNFNNPIPTIVDSSGGVGLQAQLTALDNGTLRFISRPVSQSRNFELPMPRGRCYRLATFLTGVRQFDTRDVFGNDNEVIDYGRIPSSASLDGPETKWIGFHDGSRIYEQSNRPLYANDAQRTRYYSSAAHRSAHQSQFPKEVNFPSQIIPANYFMILSFSETGTPFIGQISLLGSDNNVYVLPSQPWAFGNQDDTSKSNSQKFHWLIYQWSPPAGVTVNYAFVSNVGGFVPPPPPPVLPLTFVKGNPGSALLAEDVNVDIGTVSGGFIIEGDSQDDPDNLRNLVS